MRPPSAKWVDACMSALSGKFDGMAGRRFTEADLRDMASRQGMSYLLKYSVIVVSSLPLLIMYPFVLKYYTKDVLAGGVKG